jgi:alanine dehydrogenase
MPAYCAGAAGIKWVNSHPRNPELFGRPTVGAVIVYSDPRNGEALALMDGTRITALRTAAAAAVATQCLARVDARSVGVIGCGVQARHALAAILHTRPVGPIALYDRRDGQAEQLRCALGRTDAVVASAEEAAACDILLTCTPGLGPVLRDAWVGPGTHVNAIGADAPGKQEVDAGIVLRTRVIVDDREQAIHSGEINVPIEPRVFDPQEIAATLGEVLVGAHPGRQSDDQVTLFDSTGLAIQDVAVARCAYDRAVERGVGTRVDLG